MNINKRKENFKHETIAMLICMALVICATNHLPDLISIIIAGIGLIYYSIRLFKREGKK